MISEIYKAGWTLLQNKYAQKHEKPFPVSVFSQKYGILNMSIALYACDFIHDSCTGFDQCMVLLVFVIS